MVAVDIACPPSNLIGARILTSQCDLPQVSARRWQRLGFLRTCLVNQAILAGWACGVPPDTLAHWYYGPPAAATAAVTASSGGGT